jgi:tryptophan 2,3-dioxygenase
VYELWFKQMLHEIRAIMRRLDGDRVLPAAQGMHRIHAIQRVLIQQLPLLETMFAVDFAAFRDGLRPASGFQSLQFRMVEFLSGPKSPKYLELLEGTPEEIDRLMACLRAPTVYDHFLRFLHRNGFEMPANVLERDTSQTYEGHEAVLGQIEKVYRDSERNYPIFRMAEHLIEYDELASIWRFNHVKMVERMIGGQSGTGGSSGAAYLASRVGMRYFPELWSVRDALGGAYGEGGA